MSRRGLRLRAALAKEFPGLAIAVVGGIIKVKDKGGAVAQKGDGENVAEASVRDVGDHKIYVGPGIGRARRSSMAGSYLRSCTGGRPDGLDLDTPEAAFPDENEIKGVAVSPRFGDSKALGDGLVHDDEFGDVATLLAMEPSARSPR